MIIKLIINLSGFSGFFTRANHRAGLRRMLVAGAPLDLKLKARVEEEFGQSLFNNYGITECSPSLTGVRVDSPRSDKSVGRFLPGIEHRLVDSKGAPVPNGEVGELHVRGPNVMLGYYRAPELTTKAPTNGHVTAAVPTTLMNSRRLIRSPRRRAVASNWTRRTSGR